MSEWYDNQSAEVVLRQPRAWSKERKCLEGCLSCLKCRERALITQPVDDVRARNDLAIFLGVSVIQVKEIRSKVEKCLRKCLKEIEDSAL